MSPVFRWACLVVWCCVPTLLRSASPQPPTPDLQVIQPAPGGVGLGWADSGADFDYTIQYRMALGPGAWIAPRWSRPWPVSAREWVDPAAGPAGSRFYRVLAVNRAQRGAVVRVDPNGTYPAWMINFALANLQVGLTVTNDVDLYKVLYETVDPWGGRTVASGSIALPHGRTNALALCSYQHGTLAKRAEAPSVSSSSNERFLGLVLAATGYAAVLPDYLGLGESQLVHPYHHAASEATAGVDLLRAVRVWCAANKVALNGQLFLIGYSQGGHATMALQRELEEYHTDEFTVTASAPMAGAYDLSGTTLEDGLSDRPLPNPYYFALGLICYQTVNHIASSWSEVLASPYDTTLPPLLNGEHTGAEINAAMPALLTQVLRPAYLAALRSQPDHPLRQALRENDLIHWTPKSPTRMYHCRGDGDVVFANSEVALASFQARGAANVQLIDPQPTADHGGCVVPGLLQAKAWFDSLRQ